jgi:hypothetical protein
MRAWRVARTATLRIVVKILDMFVCFCCLFLKLLAYKNMKYRDRMGGKKKKKK